MNKKLTVEMTPALEAYMMERRDYYNSNFPTMSRQDRVERLTEDFFKEGMRLKGAIELVSHTADQRALGKEKPRWSPPPRSFR